MDDHLRDLEAGLSRLVTRRSEIIAELDKKESYTDQIERYKNLVEDLDKKLGVDKT